MLHRDGYACQSGRKVKHDAKLHVHHRVFRSRGGSDAPSNLVTLCEACHTDLHAGKFQLPAVRSKTKHASEVGIVKATLLKSDWAFEPTFGYETKFKREQGLKWEKSHAADAVAICLGEGKAVFRNPYITFKRHVAKGDYQQTKGSRSEKRIPTGKLFGLRKFDLIKTALGIGFIKGKRSSGRFAISHLDGTVMHPSVNVRTATRLCARSTTLTQTKKGDSSHA